ncbi:glycerophosphodiester phosphodiesterase [Alteribacillus bidgolensis]|uniref:Glycerophosphoryl diester phosphodiesterase n=1 Tax=Alteribacillus bidgolensis TaxID=930129 RepID=A0A1G8CWK4_9BACI|nr:glycerophosphodiester phosphodiesterase family protein [Alteribacillus bidgolensis]SDH49881.1 glycerophosphoryl diester phosphodiesterase [Alteribacillus bidgolensis]
MNDNSIYPIVLLLFILTVITAPSMQRKAPIIIAHRGASFYAPENTMAAFDQAIKMKADMLEMDIQVTKDGKLVILHDFTVDRTTNGSGNIYELTFKEIKNLDAGSWFHPDFKSEPIPTLEETLDLYYNKAKFLIDVKHTSYPGIVHKCSSLLKKKIAQGMEPSTFVIQSFDSSFLKKLKKQLPVVETGLLIPSHSMNSYQWIKKNIPYVNYINPPVTVINQEIIDQFQRHSLKTFPWGINDPITLRHVFGYTIDGIVVNDPLLIQKTVEHKSSNYESPPSLNHNDFFAKMDRFLSEINIKKCLYNLNEILEQLGHGP